MREVENAPPELTQWGFPLSYYRQFSLTAEQPALSPQEAHARFESTFPGYIDDYYERYFDWQQHYRYFPWDMLRKAFTFEECLRMWWSDVIMSGISDELDKNPGLMLFHKIKNSLWHWGHTENWACYVKWFHALLNFDFGVPGFDVYLDHASWHNEFGYSQWARTFFDGALGYNVVHNGERVLTIAFSASKHGCLVSQVQTGKKTGNRWLFRLRHNHEPVHHLDYCLERLNAAFPFPMFLVSGDSMANHIAKVYGKEKTPDPDNVKYVRKFYDRPLVNFRRGCIMNKNGLDFYRLITG